MKIDALLPAAIWLFWGFANTAHAIGLPLESAPLATVTGVEVFLKQSPVALAKAVIKSGDIKFLAVAGFTVVAPGIDNKRCFVARERVYFIPGTSDMLEGEQQFSLQSKATHAAGEYNRVIRAHLAQRGLLKSFMDCSPSSGRVKESKGPVKGAGVELNFPHP